MARPGYGQTTAQAGGPGTSLREREGARGLVVSGWRPRERRLRAVPCARQPEMREEAVNDGGVIDRGDQLHATGTEKIGVAPLAIKSGEMKDAGSPFRSLTAQERAVFQSVINEMYGRFVGLIARSRKIPEDRVRTFADSRIYTAEQAKALGLVDEIGYMDDVVAAARKAAGIEEARVIMYQRPKEYRSNFYSAASAPVPSTSGGPEPLRGPRRLSASGARGPPEQSVTGVAADAAEVLPALNLLWISLSCSCCTRPRRCRSTIRSPVPIIRWNPMTQPAAVNAIKAAKRMWRPRAPPPLISPPRRRTCPAWLLDPVRHRRNALEIPRDSCPIDLRHILEARQRSLDRLLHESTGDVPVRPVARAEERHDLLLGPVAEAGRLVRRDVRRRLPLGPRLLGIAGEEARIVHGHGQGRSRRVTLAAVADGAHKVLAARDTRDRRGRRRRLRRREGHEPGGQEDALEHRHRDLLRRVGPVNRRDSSEEGHQRPEIILGHPVEGGEGVDRHDALAVRTAAEADRRDDLRVRPGADAGLGIGRDVGRVHRAEGPVEFPAARVGGSLGLGVAAAARRGAEDVLAARDLGRRRRERGAGGVQERGDRDDPHGHAPNARRPEHVPISHRSGALPP